MFWFDSLSVLSLVYCLDIFCRLCACKTSLTLVLIVVTMCFSALISLYQFKVLTECSFRAFTYRAFMNLPSSSRFFWIIYGPSLVTLEPHAMWDIMVTSVSQISRSTRKWTRCASFMFSGPISSGVYRDIHVTQTNSSTELLCWQSLGKWRGKRSAGVAHVLIPKIVRFSCQAHQNMQNPEVSMVEEMCAASNGSLNVERNICFQGAPLQSLTTASETGEKSTWTCGCFDALHSHIR